jgi:hypothetical protein
MDDRKSLHAGAVKGPSFDKLDGFKDFLGVQSESSDRDNTVPQVVLRYGIFRGWRPNTPTGQPHLAMVDVGGGNTIYAHVVHTDPTYPTLPTDSRVVVMTWGVAQAILLGRLYHD